jgi:hypothetical protein
MRSFEAQNRRLTLKSILHLFEAKRSREPAAEVDLTANLHGKPLLHLTGDPVAERDEA